MAGPSDEPHPAVDSRTEPDSIVWLRERLRLAIEAARLGPWEWDIAGGKVHWSPSLETIHGIPIGSFNGTFEDWKRDIHPDDVERVLGAVEEGLANKTGHNLDYRIVRPDGAVRWLEVRSNLICDHDGRPLRLMGVCMDITERKQVEEARELFIGMLGHDLRNPLQAARTAAQLMERDSQLPANLSHLAHVVSRSTERMDRIIGDLLDFARGRLGQGIPLTLHRTSLEAPCRRAVDELAVVNPDRELQMVVNGDTVGLWDPERVAQVASNLVGNAIVHGVGPVQVLLDGAPSSVTLQVRNQGQPIAPDTLPFLFQPFSTRHSPKDGLGLGLFIANAIVKAHQGRIEVASADESGTVFTVHWPRRA